MEYLQNRYKLTSAATSPLSQELYKEEGVKDVHVGGGSVKQKYLRATDQMTREIQPL